MVLKATGIQGGGVTPNANAHVNDLTKSIQPQRGKIDFPKLTDLNTRLADMDRDGIDMQVTRPIPAVSSMRRRRRWRATAATWSTITSPAWSPSIPTG